MKDGGFFSLMKFLILWLLKNTISIISFPYFFKYSMLLIIPILAHITKIELIGFYLINVTLPFNNFAPVLFLSLYLIKYI